MLYDCRSIPQIFQHLESKCYDIVYIYACEKDGVSSHSCTFSPNWDADDKGVSL